MLSCSVNECQCLDSFHSLGIDSVSPAAVCYNGKLMVNKLVRFALGMLVCALTLLCGAQAVVAKNEVTCPICHRATQEDASYSEKAGHTLARGAANTLLGWTDLIRQPAQEARRGGNVFMGLAEGAGQSVKRTLGGIGDLLTFWTPKVQGRYVHFAHDCPVCAGKSK